MTLRQLRLLPGFYQLLVGDAFCIFLGPTPVSISENPRAYSPVNIFGKILGDATELKQVNNGELLTIKAGGFYD